MRNTSYDSEKGMEQEGALFRASGLLLDGDAEGWGGS